MELSSQQQIQEDEYIIPYQHLMGEDKLIAYPNKLIISPDYVETINVVLTKLEPFNGQTILDAGCGDGRFCFELRNKNAVIHGLDYSQRATDFAKIYNPNATIKTGDLTKELPYDNETFDQIVLIETLEHLKPELLSNAVSELSRILKRKGSLVITVPHKNRKIDSKHYQHFTSGYLNELLKSEFKVEQLEGFHNANIFFNIFYNLIAAIYYFLYPLKKIKLDFIVNEITKFGFLYFRRVLRDCPADSGFTLICVATKK